jgi:hypothetical protein
MYRSPGSLHAPWRLAEARSENAYENCYGSNATARRSRRQAAPITGASHYDSALRATLSHGKATRYGVMRMP